MAKILKFVHAETEGVSPYGRDLLESFPDRERLKPAFHIPSDEPVEILEDDVPIDPDLIRAEIMEAARYDAEEKVKAAYQEGLARGAEAGRKAFDISLAQCTETLRATGDALQETHMAFLATLEPEVLGLVRGIVRKIIGMESKNNPELIQHTVRRALGLLTDAHEVTLHVNPLDLEALHTHEVDLLDDFPPITSLILQGDESIEPGGCIASTDATDVDARLETILDQVLHDLTE